MKPLSLIYALFYQRYTWAIISRRILYDYMLPSHPMIDCSYSSYALLLRELFDTSSVETYDINALFIRTLFSIGKCISRDSKVSQ